METAEQTARPVSVMPKRRRKRSEIEPQVEPVAVDLTAEFIPETDLGQPDHSLVPVPAKRLLPPEEFFRFWRSIPKRERDAWFIAYVYRKLPVCDVLQPLSIDELRAIERHQKKKPESNCAKVAEPLDPERYELEVCERWGAGDYHLRLNDTHPSVRGTICETQIRGLRDWDNFPPILKEAEVVLEEPLNQPYLRWARLRGIKFPGDPGAETNIERQENEEDMALQATVEKLTDRVIEMSTENSARPAAPPADPANSRALDVMAEGFKHIQSMTMEGYKAAQSAQAKTQDPMEFHKAVTEAAKAMVPPPASAGPSLADIMAMVSAMLAPISAANTAMLTEVRSRAESAERRAEALETRLYAQQQAPVAPVPGTVAPEVSNPVKNAIDLLKGLASLKDQAGSLLGDSGVDADMPVWARVASKVIDVAPGMLYNAAVMKSGQGTPVPPDLDPNLIQAESQQNGNGEQPPQVAAAPPTEEPMNNQRIAREIAAPLVNALNEKRRGFEFAAGMILTPKILGFSGRVVYEMAVAEGQDGMYAILQSYPELWQKLTLIPTQFGVFLSEFLDRKTAYSLAEQSQNPAPAAPVSVAPEPAVQTATPEVLPPEKVKRGGRTVINPADGKPIHTGPVVNTESA